MVLIFVVMDPFSITFISIIGNYFFSKVEAIGFDSFKEKVKELNNQIRPTSMKVS